MSKVGEVMLVPCEATGVMVGVESKVSLKEPKPVPRFSGEMEVKTAIESYLPGLAQLMSVSNKFVFRYPPIHSPEGP
jgi:hypothetical protein